MREISEELSVVSAAGTKLVSMLDLLNGKSAGK